MNKVFLSAAILAVVFTNQANAVNILSKDDAKLDFFAQLRLVLQTEEDKDTNLRDKFSRAGIKAHYTYNEHIDVIGLMSWNIKADSGEQGVEPRQNYIGMSTDYGTLAFGRQWLVGAKIFWDTDPAYAFGETAIRGNKVQGPFHSSYISYEFANDDFWIKAGHGLGEDDNKVENVEISEAWGGVKFKEFDLFGGYVHDNTQISTINQSTIGIKYKAKDLELYTYYTDENIDYADGSVLKGTAYAFTGKYFFTEQTNGYFGHEINEQELNGIDTNSSNNYIGLAYQAKKWLLLYSEVAVNDGTVYAANGKNAYINGADNNFNYALGARLIF